MTLVTHSRTQKQIDSYLNLASHGLILSGAEGSGKYYLATTIATKISDEYITIDTPEDKSTISIEQIRELYSLTRTGSSLTVIIKDAQKMGTEAQNAFLKLLEEPPKHTSFILTTTKTESLLSTIRSRAQVIEVLPPPANILISEAAEKGFSSQEVQGYLHTTNNLPGKFFTLLNSGDSSNHLDAVLSAKQFYSTNAYQRHKICQQNNYDKLWAQQLLSLLATIVQALLKQNSSNEGAKQKLIAQAELIEITAVNILKLPGNPKIHLAKLCEEL